MQIRPATAADDPILVRHYLALWESYGTPPEHYWADSEARILAFIVEGRDRWRLAAFLAEEGGEVVGSVACQMYASPYPEVVAAEHRCFGYIWSVYVDPQHRRRGVARGLVERAVAHLKAMDCTHVALHASEAGKPLYEGLGFEPATEMRLPLRR